MMVNNYFAHFIDFSKAFGYVARDILLFKLIKYGHYRVNVYVQGCKIKSETKNTFNNDFLSMTGVRQRGCLSLILFAMYIYDNEK